MNRLPRPVAFVLVCPLLSGVAGADMTLSSTDLVDGGTLEPDQVFDGFGCDGADLSPALSWSGAPEGTKGYVVTAFDPDAPTGSGWWHWSVFDLPAGTTSLPEGAGAADGAGLPPAAVQARNDFGANAFGGACPPEGDAPHRYVFTVFAMPEETLGLDPDASPALVGFFAETTSLARASIEATYGR